MAFNIENFRSALADNGARPNLFEVEITFGTATISTPRPFESSGTSDLKYLCQSATLPGKTVSSLDVQYRGRTIHIPGITNFNTWTTNIINNDGSIRKKITDWMRKLGGAGDGGRTDVDNNLYGSAKVKQLSKTGTEIQTYIFTNFFPINVGEIPLDWGTDTLQTFSCTWRYDYWSHTDVDSLVVGVAEGTEGQG